MSEPRNIPPMGTGKSKQPLTEDKLLRYLDGKLSAAEQHEVEEWLADEGMESDALEGLHTVAPDETKQSVARLNHQLRKTLHTKKPRRRPPPTNYYTLIAVVVILVLVIVAYFVVRKSAGNF